MAGRAAGQEMIGGKERYIYLPNPAGPSRTLPPSWTNRASSVRRCLWLFAPGKGAGWGWRATVVRQLNNCAGQTAKRSIRTDYLYLSVISGGLPSP
jgi:hypothetical protein